MVEIDEEDQTPTKDLVEPMAVEPPIAMSVVALGPVVKSTINVDTEVSSEEFINIDISLRLIHLWMGSANWPCGDLRRLTPSSSSPFIEWVR